MIKAVPNVNQNVLLLSQDITSLAETSLRVIGVEASHKVAPAQYFVPSHLSVTRLINCSSLVLPLERKYNKKPARMGDKIYRLTRTRIETELPDRAFSFRQLKENITTHAQRERKIRRT